jgi:Holliday junction resolvasome RuvABC endonuclease subunit
MLALQACQHDRTRHPARVEGAMSEPATLRVMGVDPGLASLGVAVIEKREERVMALAARVLRTKKASQKMLRDLRVSADDQRRLGELWDGLVAIVTAHRPQGLAIESYAPQPGRGGSGGWKSAVVYGVVYGLGRANDCTVLPFWPGDLKRKLTGKASASKDEVATVVLGEVAGLAELLHKIPRTQREHVTDAAGHALLGLREMLAMRRMMGMETFR